MTPGSSRESTKWLTLCDLVVSGEADDAQHAEFEARLAADPSLADSYLNYADLSFDLHQAFCRDPAVDLATVLVANSQDSRKLRSVAWQAAAPVLVLAASFAALAYFLWPGKSLVEVAHPTWAPSVALIGRVDKVVWGDQGTFEIGSLLVKGQRIEIESGDLEIEFGQGAVVVIEGPALLTLSTANSAVLESGRLAAIVPPWANGFRVDTPSLRLVDRGTQFAVAVNSDRQTDLAVTKGEVQVSHGQSPRGAADTRLVTAGGGVRSGSAGVVATEINASLAGLTKQLPERPDESQVEYMGAYQLDFSAGVPDQPRQSGPWRYYTNARSKIGDPDGYQELLWDPADVGWYDLNGSDTSEGPPPLSFVKLRPNGGHPGHGGAQSIDGIDHYAIAAFTVPKAGVYHLESGWLVRPENRPELLNQGIDLLVHVDRAEPVLRLDCEKDRHVRFRGKLGELPAGATIYVAVGPRGPNYNDRFEWGFVIAREIATDSAP